MDLERAVQMDDVRGDWFISQRIQSFQDFPDFRPVNRRGVQADFQPFGPNLRDQRQLLAG